MAFSSGNTTMDSLIESIADGLIATGAWADADPTGRPAGASPARRTVQHITDGIFISLQRRITSQGYNQFNEIGVDVSSNYDTNTSSPSGTIEVTGIPTEVWQYYGTTFSPSTHYWATSTGSGNKTGQFWMWLDDEGFTVLATWTSSPAYDYSSFLNVERNTLKEYVDGYSNFFITAWTNNDHQNVYSTSNNWYNRYYAQYFDSTSGQISASGEYGDRNRKEYIRPFNTSTVERDYGVEAFEAAYRSDGNSKIYFHFPYYSNNLDTLKRMPVAQTKRWFIPALSQGLADGDIVDWVDGAVTKSYIVKTIQSPDSTAYLVVAFRQG